MVSDDDHDMSRAGTSADQRHFAVLRGRDHAGGIERESGGRPLDPPRHDLLILDGQRLRKGLANGERQDSDQKPADRRQSPGP